MTDREPVLLVVLLETGKLRWYAAAIDLSGGAAPLLRSQPRDLHDYLGREFDEQASFLRHRLAGVLQFGCDRLWARGQKPCQIVFLADGPFVRAPVELTQRVAEHFVQWMCNPPVVFISSGKGFVRDEPPRLEIVAGELPPEYGRQLSAGLPSLISALDQSDAWEPAAARRSP